MRWVLICAVACVVLLVLGATAIGAMVSSSSGHTSWLLIGIFVFDSLALLLLAARMTVWRRNGTAGR